MPIWRSCGNWRRFLGGLIDFGRAIDIQKIIRDVPYIGGWICCPLRLLCELDTPYIPDRRRLPRLSFAPEFGPLQIHGRIPFSLDSSACTRRSQVTSGPWTELNESLYWRTYVRAANKNDVASLKGLPEMIGMLKCKPTFLPEASLGSSSSWVVLVWVWRVVV